MGTLFCSVQDNVSPMPSFYPSKSFSKVWRRVLNGLPAAFNIYAHSMNKERNLFKAAGQNSEREINDKIEREIHKGEKEREKEKE